MPALRTNFVSWRVAMTCALLIAIGIAGCSATQNLPNWMKFTGGKGQLPTAWQSSHPEALIQAAQSNKPIMLFFTGSDWCKYCTMLEEEVFHTDEFTAWYPNNIIPVVIDFPRQSELSPELKAQNEALKVQYENEITGFPTALFVDMQGNVYGKLGYSPGGPREWIRQAQIILRQPPMSPGEKGTAL